MPIDARLEDCSSEIEIAENFNRILALIDANAQACSTNTQNVTGLDGRLDDLEEGLARRTVTFDSDGGIAVDPQTVFYGGVAVAPEDPTKAEATFAGWNLGESAYDFTAAVTTDITLVAQWT